MSGKPNSSVEYFREYGFSEVRDDPRIRGYIIQIGFFLSRGNEFGAKTVLMDAQDYAGSLLNLTFNGYFFPNENEKLKL